MTFNDEPVQGSGEPKCLSEIRGFIAGMEELMNSRQEYNNAAIPSQIAVDLINEDILTSLSQFETLLRNMGSRVHFIAVPLDFYGPHWASRTKYPNHVEGDPEYTLWVGVNGDKEAEEQLSHLHISPEDNLQRLLRTGILVLDE